MSNGRLKLCMISGSFEYDSEESLGIFKEYIEKNFPVDATLIVYKDEEDNKSLAPLETTDVLLVFTRRLETKGEELERFKNYCLAGKPVVGLRTASHAFQNWLDFDKVVLGGNYQGHYGFGPKAPVSFESGVLNHPVLEGVNEFTSHGSLYANTPIAEDTTLLMTAEIPDHIEPVAWVRMNNGGRTFYTSLGHQQDFREPDFLRVIANAVLWAGGKL
jgi:type 1 glutamine amidotransferase